MSVLFCHLKSELPTGRWNSHSVGCKVLRRRKKKKKRPSSNLPTCALTDAGWCSHCICRGSAWSHCERVSGLSRGRFEPFFLTLFCDCRNPFNGEIHKASQKTATAVKLLIIGRGGDFPLNPDHTHCTSVVRMLSEHAGLLDWVKLLFQYDGAVHLGGRATVPTTKLRQD